MTYISTSLRQLVEKRANYRWEWRICFNWHDNHAYNVEIVDYH